MSSSTWTEPVKCNVSLLVGNRCVGGRKYVVMWQGSGRTRMWRTCFSGLVGKPYLTKLPWGETVGTTPHGWYTLSKKHTGGFWLGLMVVALK